MLKTLRILCICLVFAFGGMAWYGKQVLDSNKIDYNNHLEQKLYLNMEVDVAIHEPIKGLVDDKSIHELSDLEKQSNYILKIKAAKEKQFIGKGVINNCKILNVIKGEKLYKGDTILIYEQATDYFDDGINYIDGAKPVLADKEYIVFLNKAPNPNKKGTYMFSSINFGNFAVNGTSETITDYQNTLSIEDTDKYAYIASSDKYKDTYLRLQDQIIKKYKL